MRSGQPPDRIRTWIPKAASSPLGGGMTASARQRSRRSAAFAKASRRFVISRSPTCDCCGGQRSFPAPVLRRATERGGGGGRNARATSRACARFSGVSPGNSPSRIAGCRWLCRNHSASSGTLTFRCTHSQPVCCASQYKKLGALCRSCGRCDFPVEARGKLRINISP
jgi:hypothetical protein